MELSLTFALFRRLSGYPLDSHGRPQTDPATQRPLNVDGKFGMRIPLQLNGNARTVLGTDNPDAIKLFEKGLAKDAYAQVPVYLRGTENRDWQNIWPCVTYQKVDETQGSMQWTYSDTIADHGNGTATIVNPVSGATATEADYYNVRRRGNVFDVWFVFSLWSKNNVEMILLEAAFKRLFDRQGSIIIDTQDGTLFPVNYERKRYQVLDQGNPGDPAAGPGRTEESYFRRDITYAFWLMEDNSVNGFGNYDINREYTILQRILQAQDTLTRAFQALNLEQYRPLT